MRKLWKIAAIVAASVAVVWVGVMLINPEREAIDDATRARSVYDFVQLSEGYTELEIAGPPEGEPVVLIHGLSVPMYDWDPQFAFLASEGYRVLRYNQYGRGMSDRPRGRYDLHRYVAQLRELIEAQGWSDVHLVGHSMGCAVAAGFAAAHPEMVRSVMLISPVLDMSQDNAGIALARIPVLGAVAARLALPGSLASRADDLLVNAGVPDPAPYREAFREQMRYRGFTRSVRSLFRNDVVEDLTATYVGLRGAEVAALWGAEDESVPPAHFSRITELVPGMSTLVLDGIGHAPNMEVPDLTNAAILAYISR